MIDQQELRKVLKSARYELLWHGICHPITRSEAEAIAHSPAIQAIDKLLSSEAALICKHCLDPIRDNGTVYVHIRRTFIKGKHYIIESQWCNEEERTHMAEAAAALGADEGRGEG